MAIMHLNNSKYIKTESEKIFFEALKNQLNDDFHIFYSVIWFSKDNDGKKKHSECDFLIFNKHYGFLVVEVKGGRKIEFDGYNWKLYSKDNYRILNSSPIVQAEESMYYFKDYFRKETRESFAGIYAVAVAFPFYNIEKDLGPGMSEDVLISLKDMNNLENKIIKLFKYHGKASSPEKLITQEEKFINCINKKVVLSIAAGAVIEVKEKELEEINKVQDAIIDFLYNYREAFIIGGAGTGKTYIGMKKIKKLLNLNKKCLYLSYNQSLNEFVNKEISNSLLDCYTFDKLMVKTLGKDKYFDANYKNFYGILENLRLPKYDLIVIDEAQDFNDDWAKSVRLFLNKEGLIYVFYDKSQNIFERDFRSGFNINYPPFILKHNIRNTKEIYNFITNATGIGEEIEPSIIEGARPETVEFVSDDLALNYLSNLIIRLIEEDLVDPKDITILSDRKKENTFLKSIDKIGKCFINSEKSQKETKRTIKFRSIQGFKGLESSIVIYLNFIRNNEKDTDKKRRLYTAFSRAKYFLYVININYLKK